MVAVPVPHLWLAGAAQLPEYADVAGEKGWHEKGPDDHGYYQQYIHFPLVGHPDDGLNLSDPSEADSGMKSKPFD